MQQTEKYKLNLIESSDPFLPDGLNENTRKLEQVVSQHLEGMEQRVTVLEAHKFACGYYLGNGSDVEQFMLIGFKPKGIIIKMVGSLTSCHYVEGSGRNEDGCRPAGDGFYAVNSMNTGGHWYLYFVFA